MREEELLHTQSRLSNQSLGNFCILFHLFKVHIFSMAKENRNGKGNILSNDFLISTIVGVMFGFILGITFPKFYKYQVDINPVVKNPRGAELLPSGIIQSESDFYLRRLWGDPDEDLAVKMKYLVAFTVGAKQKMNINAAVKKFSNNFTILLFHYDGRIDEWDEFEWSKQAIHISVVKQAKWWYAKRFLHPDIVDAYEYIFLWDEDFELENFDAEEYIKIMKKHGLEISQPGIESEKEILWNLTKRQENKEIHRYITEISGVCSINQNKPPCAKFVEIMAPVFTRKAWRCIWYMIHNDLGHGCWLDFVFRRCVESPNETIGIIDSQWMIIHQKIPILGEQGVATQGKEPWKSVGERCCKEAKIFQERLRLADPNDFKENKGGKENFLHSPPSTIKVGKSVSEKLLYIFSMAIENRNGKRNTLRNEFVINTIAGIMAGFILGITFTKFHTPEYRKHINNTDNHPHMITSEKSPKVGIPIVKNPRGAELLPLGIIQSESDFHLRRLWGDPNEDLTFKQKYLVAFTVGAKQKMNIDAAVKKFSNNFTILLFHYDGRIDEWDEFEWSKQVIHINVGKQAKWWYAKRFLHPDIVDTYEYIFIWDEDLGLENFDAEEYIKIVKKHGLEISQPGVKSEKEILWKLTKRQENKEIHRFVEIMAPVFTRKAWRCVWYMIQNDLGHGWELDYEFRRCVESPNETMGIVDSQWIIHQSLPTLGDQGVVTEGKKKWQSVHERCWKERNIFKERLHLADLKDFKEHR
ncbi:hypothetical protein ZOSMA_92G00300 [Zostera marina]|uniref:Lysine ketoglutarate reductase trans-splicing related 1 n=1 Tax=Zostera marina TaxID=29655 RepID=A0A0K9NIU5_ZOSMR|nr:hypothetical protein ZOSMA_92G00300 [Zostera marina]